MSARLCERPGCVAAALPRTARCAVHAREGLGERCPRCKGTGVVWRVLGGVAEACDRCGGCGLLDQSTRAPRRPRKADPVDARGLIQRSEEEP